MNAWLMIEHYPELFCLHKDKDLFCTYNSTSKNEWKIPISFIVQSGSFLNSTTTLVWIEPDEVKIISGIHSDNFYLIDAELFGKHGLFKLLYFTHTHIAHFIKDLKIYVIFYVPAFPQK